MNVMALREGWREQRRHPWRFVANVLALGLSLALSATLFGIIDGLVLRPLPFRDSDALYFGPTDRTVPGAFNKSLNIQEIEALSDLAIVETAGGFFGRVFDSHLQERDQVVSAGVSGRFFETLGLSPFLPGGVTIWQHPDPDVPAVVVGRDVARRLTGSGDIAAGTLLTIAGRQTRVAGISPRDFDFPRGTNVWVHANRTTIRAFSAVLRLRSSATAVSVGDGLPPMRIRPLAKFDQTPRTWSPALIALIAFAGVIAVFVHQATAWLSSMLSRSQVRDIRAALGASDWQLALEAVAEMAFVVAAAVLFALLLLPSAVAAALHLLPADLLAGRAVRVDGRLFVFLALIAGAGMLALTACAALLGRRLSGAQLGSRLYQRAPSNRMGAGPHIVMVCLQMFLIVSSGYLSIVAVRSYVLTMQQSLGFNPDNLLSIRIPEVGGTAINTAHRLALRERLESLNGVVSVGGGPLPLGRGRLPVSVSTEPPATAMELGALPRNADEQRVDHSWFRTVGVAVVEGRHFEPGQDPSGDSVILTASLARVIGNGRPLVGRTIWMRGSAKTVVGIAADVWNYGPEAGPVPLIYVFDQQTGDLVVRTAVPPSQLFRSIQQIIEQTIGQASQPAISLASERYAEITQSQRGQAMLLGTVAVFNVLFGSISLLRSASAFASARLKETAVRIAMGAPQIHAVVFVVRRLGYALVGGAAFGLLGGVLLAGAGSALWYGIDPLDGMSMAVVILMAIGTLAMVAVKITRSILSANLVRLLSEQ